MPAINPFLWFDDQAEEAVDFYVSIFPNSRVLDVARAPESAPGPTGSVITIRFSLDGTEFVALNGGPAHYGFDESISFTIDCATQEEVDRYWEALLQGGGEEIACGWLKDRYGLRWQVVPSGLPALIGDPDPERASRAMAEMMTQTKLDIRAIEEAADGVRQPD